MNESRFYLKYDGETDSYKNHQIDAKELAQSLDNLADLIYDANTIINGPDSYIRVNAQAGFIEGSFGLEMVVGQDIGATKEILEYLGFAGSAITGGLLSLIMNMRNRKVSDIDINEETGMTKINVGSGEDEEEFETPNEVYELLNSQPIRKRLDKIIKKPLESQGTSSFQVLASADENDEPLLVITDDSGGFFKAPRSPKAKEVEESETVATIQFMASNKEKGTSGWRMIHLGEEVPVKIKDDVFLATIKRADAPSIYGLKFSVDLHVKINIHPGKSDTRAYTINKVRSVIRD